MIYTSNRAEDMELDGLFIFYEKDFTSDKCSKKPAVDEVARRASIHPDIDSDSLYLVIDEAVTNAMEHGNNWDPDKSVYVCLAAGEKTLCISIRDEGSGFDYQHVVNKYNHNCFDPRGRGIHIIQQLCQSRWNNLGNHILLEMKF